MRNGSPLFTLVSGYIGSQILGGFYVALAFDERCSKITYLIHAPLWPAVFWFTVGVWPKIQMLIWVGASISLWFSECAQKQAQHGFLALISAILLATQYGRHVCFASTCSS